MKRGTTAISKVMRGTTAIQKIMRGTILIWENWVLNTGRYIPSSPTYSSYGTGASSGSDSQVFDNSTSTNKRYDYKTGTGGSVMSFGTERIKIQQIQLYASDTNGGVSTMSGYAEAQKEDGTWDTLKSGSITKDAWTTINLTPGTEYKAFRFHVALRSDLIVYCIDAKITQWYEKG